jgi:hypothetical protein
MPEFALPGARLCTIFCFALGAMLAAPATWAAQFNHPLAVANAPVGLTLPKRQQTVVVAVVDDGVRISHRGLAGFIWQNPLEKPGNRIDDDGNGYIDDVYGWDVSDNDNDVTVPPDRSENYSHGTHIAGIVAQIARRAYGEAAADAVRILPVKAMSDVGDGYYVKEGFEGIRYAIAAGADIIICAWGVGHITREQEQILQEAEQKGVLIVAAAGNIPQELEQFPAAYPSVIAVTGLDHDGQKAEKSSYGQFVDIAAPGTEFPSASAVSDSSHLTGKGSSTAAAIVAGGAALVSVEHADFSPVQLRACLVSSADGFAQLPADLNGKIGAGRLNIARALECELLQNAETSEHVLSATRGFLRLDATRKKETSWLIEPAGRFNGIRFRPATELQTKSKGTVKFFTDASPGALPAFEFPLNAIPESVYLPGSSAYVVLQTKDRNRQVAPLLEYEFETIDFSKLYCDGTKVLSREGIIEDGSGPNDYSPASDCKWLITAPEGYLVHFNFVEFDTEAKVDSIMFFDGDGTHESMMARFSGSEIPPQLTSWRNQVLVWFASNREIQGKGWKAEVSFVPQ